MTRGDRMRKNTKRTRTKIEFTMKSTQKEVEELRMEIETSGNEIELLMIRNESVLRRGRGLENEKCNGGS